jgi:sugar/nucleoside kinase (ribokinase family)
MKNPTASGTMTKTIDILGLGYTAVDELVYVDAYPAADAKAPIRRRERQCGGLSATALVAAARMGCRCAYAGILGYDEHSVREACEYVRRLDCEPSRVAFDAAFEKTT